MSVKGVFTSLKTSQRVKDKIVLFCIFCDCVEKELRLKIYGYPSGNATQIAAAGQRRRGTLPLAIGPARKYGRYRR